MLAHPRLVLAVQNVEEADPHNILHRDSLQAIRSEVPAGGGGRESFGNEAVWYNSCVCSKLRAVVALPHFSMRHSKQTAQSTEAGFTEHKVVESKTDLDGGDGASLCALPLVEKGQRRGEEVRHRHRVCVCDDEISTQKTRPAQNHEHKRALSGEGTRLPSTWLPRKLQTAPPEPVGA